MSDKPEEFQQPAVRTVLLKSVDSRVARCRSCGAAIRWATTSKGKKMPVNADANLTALPGGFVAVSNASTHWATCPNAKAHKAAQRSAPSERID